MSQVVLAALRATVPHAVPADATALPELWHWQMPDILAADIIAALARDGSPASVRVLRTLLPDISVTPRLRSPAPALTRRSESMPRIHVVAPRNPHPSGTNLHRNWSRYRENMPVDVYRRLGGSHHCLEGDLRRGLIKLA